MKKDGIMIERLSGSYYLLDTKEIKGTVYHLLESEQAGEEEVIIVDDNLCVYLSNVRNGFSDLEELLESNDSSEDLKTNQKFSNSDLNSTKEQSLTDKYGKLWTSKEVMDYLSISFTTLNRWRKDGILESVKIGRDNRFLDKSIEKLIFGK